jgi:hypothetical protein
MPDIAMEAPTPATTINSYVLRDLKLQETQIGYKAWLIGLEAGLGPLLSTTLKNALRTDNLDPIDPAERTLHEHIGRAITPSILHLPQLLVQANAACGNLGPKTVKFIQSRLDPSSSASSIGKLIKIITEPLDQDDKIINCISQKVADNASLATNIKLPEPILSVILMTKLPDEIFGTLKDIIIEKDTIPTLQELQTKVKATMDYKNLGSSSSSSGTHSAFAFLKTQGNKYCFNCDHKGHTARECEQDKAHCDICDHDGHLKKYCLVASDKPLPMNMSDERKREITEKRKAFKERFNGSSGMAHVEIDESDDNFWNSILEQPSSWAAAVRQ